MTKFIYLTLLSCISCPLLAQFSLKDLADREFDKMKYAHAIELYKDHLLSNPQDDSSKLKLAIAYHKVNKTESAEGTFRSVPNLEQYGTDMVLEFAEVLAQNANYEESNFWYTKAKNMGADIEVPDINRFYKDSSLYKIYYLGINSPQADFSPTPYDEGIVFLSSRIMDHGVRRVFSWDNTPFLDLYYVEGSAYDTIPFDTKYTGEQWISDELYALAGEAILHDDDTWVTSNDTRTLAHYGATFEHDSTWSEDQNQGVIKFSKRINSKYHEGPVTFTYDGNEIYLTRNNFRPGKYKTNEEDVNELKIYTSHKNDEGEWSKVKEFPYNSNNYSTGHPSFSPDNQTLYFASNMPGGYGGTDIYKSTYENGAWTKPVNLGPPVNTESDEMFPYAGSENKLFFASDGHHGLGGLDIFEYVFDGPEPKNLGFPINSMKDDFGLVFNENGTTGYFSSNRKRGGSDDDLFMFTKVPEPPKSSLKVYVYEEVSLDTLYDIMPSVVDSARGNRHSAMAQEQGFYTYEVEAGTYVAKASRSGVVREKRVVVDTGSNDQVVGIPLPPLVPDVPKETFEIRSIYFDFDKSNIREDAVPVLEDLLKILNKYPDLKIGLSSHTDSRANHDYNVSLSERRMKSSIAYLIEHGLESQRIVSNEYMGETQLVNECDDKHQIECSTAQHQLNRRTDFVIMQ